MIHTWISLLDCTVTLSSIVTRLVSDRFAKEFHELTKHDKISKIVDHA